MGSPLGPRLANVFMNCYDQFWLDECPLEIKPKFYRRYVNIFIHCESEGELESYKDYLNSKHTSILFTSEIEEGKQPLLDMLIDRTNGKITSSVYRKPTFTGVYTHFHSFLPSVYKFGLLSTIPFRYFSLCLSFQLLRKTFEIRVIKDTVPKGEYRITLPYLGPLSYKIHKRIKNVFAKMLPSGKINILLKTQRKLTHFQRFKDKIPKLIHYLSV